MLNITFNGFLKDESDTKLAARYQAFFYGGNPNNKWNLVRNTSTNGYYNLNAGDEDALGQSIGNLPIGAKVLIVAWLSGNRNDILSKFAFIEITIDERTVYTYDIQLRDSHPPTCSFTTNTNIRHVTINNYSTDDYSYTAYGTTHYQYRTRLGQLIFECVGIKETLIDWDDGVTNALMSHDYAGVDAYLITMHLKNKHDLISICDFLTFTYYNVDPGFTWTPPVCAFPGSVTIYSNLTGDITQVTKTEYWMNGILIHTDLDYAHDFLYSFNGFKLLNPTLQKVWFNDGWEEQLIEIMQNIPMGNQPPVCELNLTTIKEGEYFRYNVPINAFDPENEIAGYKWEVYWSAPTFNLLEAPDNWKLVYVSAWQLSAAAALYLRKDDVGKYKVVGYAKDGGGLTCSDFDYILIECQTEPCPPCPPVEPIPPDTTTGSFFPCNAVPSLPSLQFVPLIDPLYSDVDKESMKAGLVYDVSSIKRSIDTILETNIRERLFNPEFGSRLEELLFEQINEDTAFSILVHLFNTISRWEPRVRLIQSLSRVTPNLDYHTYEVTIAYQIIGLEDQTFEYSGYLNPVSGQ